VNNIIWQNRSWYNDGTTTPGLGILSPNPAGLYQDLGVVFTLSPQILNPMYCVLTDTAGYNVSNLAPADPGFVLSYLNTLSTATVLDEGGNAINVSYPELSVDLGNYHLTAGSPAVNVGQGVNFVTYPQLLFDFDLQSRPLGAGVDVGADEVSGPGLAPLSRIGVYRPTGSWFLDANGNGQWDSTLDSSYFGFGAVGDTGIVGDWNGDGLTEVGVYHNGSWYLDANGNGQWEEVLDTAFDSFGGAGDIPVVGDWNGDGTSDIGIFRNGAWYLDANSNGQWDAGIDSVIPSFGGPGDLPVVGDWNGDGTSDIGIFRNGAWFLDVNNNGQWEEGLDTAIPSFGGPGDLPVIGDWNGDGISKVGIFRSGAWYLDSNGNGTWDAGVDISFASFGGADDAPLAGIWQ
jgi:hypothetical protein